MRSSASFALDPPPVPSAWDLTLIPRWPPTGATASAAAAAPAREDTHRFASSSGRTTAPDPAQQPCAFLPGIQLIVGPMFAGKTSELLRRAAELEVGAESELLRLLSRCHAESAKLQSSGSALRCGVHPPTSMGCSASVGPHMRRRKAVALPS